MSVLQWEGFSAHICVSIFPAQAAGFHIHPGCHQIPFSVGELFAFFSPNPFSSVGMTGLMENFLGWITKLFFLNQKSALSFSFNLFSRKHLVSGCTFLLKHKVSGESHFWILRGLIWIQLWSDLRGNLNCDLYRAVSLSHIRAVNQIYYSIYYIYLPDLRAQTCQMKP